MDSEREREKARATEWWRGIVRKSERVRVIDRSINKPYLQKRQEGLFS